ncbi:dUTP diphosphatase [Metamycoplasma arthritidis]|uniref:dUTPase n=2 Tax=Metamycoplasma arthritidis TaxID=2111 RepID=B3PN38_META1|nr:dUTP diphosphatase [Metamycoplasma arthritidis]ACF07440.1 conserved hypothetical protein [Metamycoplasma arthritidis 158L3-1]
MNLSDIFKAQVELDERIQESANQGEFKDWELKAVIALLVELGEFANEVKLFKYWKKHKEMDREKVLEEFADGIHFLTSFSLKYKVKSTIKVTIKYQDFCQQLAYTYRLFTSLFHKKSKKLFTKAYSAYLGLGSLVNISVNDIINSYFKKNRINHRRIDENY